MADPELSIKQEAFCHEYATDFNGTQAATRAGYSQKTASSQASTLLTYPKVQEKIRELTTQRLERVQVDGDWVLRRLVEEADADLADMYDDDGALLPIKQWPMAFRRGLVGSIKTEERDQDGETTTRVREIKMSDRTKRLEMIGRHREIAAFADPKPEGIGGVRLITDISTVEAARMIVATLREAAEEADSKMITVPSDG
jgi:phage terminase small subunit